MLDKDIISVVSEEVAYFLTIEKQAAIPGFGRFNAVAQPATINEVTNTLIAPTSKITFEQNLEEGNTNFMDYFQEYHSEVIQIDDFIESFIRTIKDENSVLLPELGMCILNKEGTVHFEGLNQSDSVLGFEANPISLKPVAATHVVTRPEGVNTPGEAAKPAAVSNSRGKLIRIGMVLSSVVLVIVLLSQYQWSEATAAGFQKVPANYNISPQDQDVIIASMDGDAPTGEVSLERKEEIVERQRLMSEAPLEPAMKQANIITNTFGNERNVEKQLQLISELGYQGWTLEKENGLVSTFITVEYQEETELEDLLDEIKKNFHRAKLKK